MKETVLRRTLLFWCLFVGLGAVGGGVTMLLDPTGEASGMAGLLPGLQTLPLGDILFANLIFSGIALIAVNGIAQLAAAALIWRRHPKGYLAGTVCGGLLMAWICIQFVIYPLNWLSTAYFVFGLLEMSDGLALLRLGKGKK